MLDRERIQDLLPHRPPMLLVDSVPILEPGRTLHALKAVTVAEPCFRDVPDGVRRTYPVSLLMESAGQAAALLLLCSARPAGLRGDETLLFAAVRDVHVEGAVRPGDVLRHEVRLDRVIAGTGYAAVVTWVGERRVATFGSLVLAIRPRSVILPPELLHHASPG
jgi:3-hydroxyacyl-[acyl-carrier-protein] dehydratase